MCLFPPRWCVKDTGSLVNRAATASLSIRVLLRISYIGRQSPRDQCEPLSLQPPPEPNRHKVRINSSGQIGTAWLKASDTQNSLLSGWIFQRLIGYSPETGQGTPPPPNTGLSLDCAGFGQSWPTEFIPSWPLSLGFIKRQKETIL